MEQKSAPRGWGFRAGLTLLVLIALGFGGSALFHHLEARLLDTGPNGETTPATVGLKFERVAIVSADGSLDGYLVRADAAACENAPALIVFHDFGQTISQWVGAQLFLHDHCVSSLVFDYAGSGDSSRPGGLVGLRKDVSAVYAFAQTAFPGTRLFVLGHGTANAPLLEAAASFKQRPAGVIVANPFASLRGAAARSQTYGLIAAVMPDWWNNVTAVVSIRAPLLVIASAADTVNPIEDARDIYAVASKPKAFAELHGLAHEALYREPSEASWQPILAFMQNPPSGK